MITPMSRIDAPYRLFCILVLAATFSIGGLFAVQAPVGYAQSADRQEQPAGKAGKQELPGAKVPGKQSQHSGTPGAGAGSDQAEGNQRRDGQRKDGQHSKDDRTSKRIAKFNALSPLQLVLKEGVPKNAIARRRLKENLYALLSVAEDKRSAKRISAVVERVWLTSGSETIDILMRRALRAHNAKKTKLSLKLLNAVIRLAPDYAEAWNRRAYVHYRRRDFRGAAGDLRRVLALDPKHFKALDGLGTILRESGDDAGALKVYERLMDINPMMPGLKTILDELTRKVRGRGI